MAWTEITRRHYRRDEPRYASDTRPVEWAQIAPLLPAPRRFGRPRERDLLGYWAAPPSSRSASLRPVVRERRSLLEAGRQPGNRVTIVCEMIRLA